MFQLSAENVSKCLSEAAKQRGESSNSENGLKSRPGVCLTRIISTIIWIMFDNARIGCFLKLENNHGQEVIMFENCRYYVQLYYSNIVPVEHTGS